ncbi:hypothetical protein OG225_38710 [Nocardia sp. NBC_01377]|uniref:hypothetical protein n=1 Tax=Nocardia TaxID=1817 RepID=UPI001C2132A9|nr:hypothetical protein [Nocardia noduli]
MLYNGPILQTLSEELATHRGALVAEAANLQAAAKRLGIAWEGNTGLDAFNIAKHKWDVEFGNPEKDGESPDSTIGIIDALSKAVEQAKNNAFHADGKVSQGFGG